MPTTKTAFTRKQVERMVANGTRALAIRGPWWWFMLHGTSLKCFENRPWNTKFRGDFLIHAGMNKGVAEFDEACAFAASQGARQFPNYDTLLRGGVVGIVTLTDCISAANLQRPKWFEGPFGFKLENPRPVPFMPNRGLLGFYTPTFTAVA